MLCDFFGRLQKTPEVVSAQEVFASAHGKGLSGKEPSLVTVGARMACLSSFFRFLMRMEMVTNNPCDRLERPKTPVSPPHGLSADEVRRLLAVVPDTPVGLRNRALIFTLVLTGRGRAEVFRLTRSDLSFDADVCFYSNRGKGGKTGRGTAKACAAGSESQSETFRGPGRLPGVRGAVDEARFRIL
jgi:site-specific recombinase XerD